MAGAFRPGLSHLHESPPFSGTYQPMNTVLQTLHEHRTYRQFDPAHQIPAEQVQAMLDATRQAPS